MPKVHTLVDNFSDGTNVLWGAVAGPGPFADRLREVNGRVEITPASGLSGSYGQYNSNVAYDLTGSRVYIEVRQALVKPGTQTLLRVFSGTQYITLSLFPNDLVCHSLNTEVGRVPYDANRHRWWQIREQGGTTYWEAGPDGTTWETLASAPNPFNLTLIGVWFAAHTLTAIPSPGIAVFDNVNLPQTPLSRRIEERRLSARDVRVQAAEVAAARRHDEHANNNDEVNYPTRPLAGSYSKSLKHDALGDPDPASYGTLLRALQSEDPADFEEIQLASSTALKLTNPQSGLAFDIAGPDAQERTMPPAPRFDSEMAAHEAGELYWMAVLRDLPFVNYGTDANASAAITSLNGEFPRFGGTVPVTAQNLFRGIYPGEQVGPYVSQFLLKGNNDPRKPVGLGRDAIEGYISYGSRYIDQRIIPAATGTDYLTDFTAWLNAQNGVDGRTGDSASGFESQRRFIYNLRAGATFVHFDQVVDAFYNAAWILMSEPSGNQYETVNDTGRAQVDLE
ncbi:MAG TPA: hypothetical protein VEQ60_00465, partial [Longimicrobium sp.]|nr:hypothetical protein [Longimicrobium sp.]